MIDTVQQCAFIEPRVEGFMKCPGRLTLSGPVVNRPRNATARVFPVACCKVFQSPGRRPIECAARHTCVLAHMCAMAHISGVVRSTDENNTKIYILYQIVVNFMLSRWNGMIFEISAERPKNNTHDQVAGSMVTFINNQNYPTEIDKAGKPVLLLCMPKGPDFSGQSTLLHQMAEKYEGIVKVCLLEEELINGFRQMLGIKGTPVYLLFFRGKEQGRMLGMAGEEQLTAFIYRHLPNPDRDPGEEMSWG